MAKKSLLPTSDLSLLNRHSSPLLPNSWIQTSVQNLAEALRQELVPQTALERSAIDEYIQVECQRHRLRLVRDQIERNFAVGHVWNLVSRAMIQEGGSDCSDVSESVREAQNIVQRWSTGDSAALDQILQYGIDIDEAISLGIFANLPQLAELERQRDHLAHRARLLLGDIERTQGFHRKRKVTDIMDAEITT